MNDSDNHQQKSASPSVTAASSNNDLFHFDESKSESFVGGAVDVDIDNEVSTSSKALSREELVARRESLVQEKVAAALEFKQEVRIMIQVYIFPSPHSKLS